MSESRVHDRSSWPVRVFRLGAEPGDDLSSFTTAEDRLEMVWTLTVEAWTLAGLPIPEYSRAQTPVRVFQRSALEKTNN